MPCETCGHTLQQISGSLIEPGRRVFWCPRCGTIKAEGEVPESETPRLVRRAIELCDGLAAEFGTVSVTLANRERAVRESCTGRPDP